MLFVDAAPSKTVREPTNLLHYDDREFILVGFWKSGTGIKNLLILKTNNFFLVLGLIGSMLIIILIGVLYEAIRAFRVFMAQNHDSGLDGLSGDELCPRSSHSNSSDSTIGFIKVAFKSITKQRIISALLYGAEMTVLCLLILFVATFNIWIILAVIMVNSYWLAIKQQLSGMHAWLLHFCRFSHCQYPRSQSSLKSFGGLFDSLTSPLNCR
jgi:hypothetical protein